MSISFHYIESNYLYYIDMNKRVDLLKKISSLDFNLLKSKDITKREYDDILDTFKSNAQKVGAIIMMLIISIIFGF